MAAIGLSKPSTGQRHPAIAAGEALHIKPFQERSRHFCFLSGKDAGQQHARTRRQQLRELIVVKKNGRRESFDRDKLERSITHALRKRPVERERVERMITGIVRRLESMGENEIPANMIGELVMQALASLDKVAYVRFASVYRNFRETRDFEALIGELEGDDKTS